MPEAAILMGSDSDLAVMKAAAETLEKFSVGYDLRILSAHRTPRETAAYVAKAPARGVRVFIAGAGSAAHLPGVIASFTNLPVIGVPISGTLQGLDAFLSMVQMPPGVPVAVVGVNAARNAALLAASILALKDKALARRLAADREEMRKEVLAKSRKAEKLGYRKYLEAMKK
ncbi:MAG TPA: 5-(carboxyamino)imidazole ribonucleotide mutase [Elusimicrobiales bacterium]|nr:5-(carboxyamino)imidazole ribonucleotide mutase [Elusimicrobiales bacterium]